MKYLGMIVGLAMLGYVAQEFVLKPKKGGDAALQSGGVAGEMAEEESLEIPPPPPEIEAAPPPVLSMKQLQRIKSSTRDTNPDVRWEAVDLLVKSQYPEADQILYEMLQRDGSPQNKLKVIAILQERTDDPNAVYALTQALRDTEADIRLSSLRALGTIGDPRSAKAIGGLLRDVDEGVRLEAIKTLNTLEEKRQSLALERAQRNRQKMEQYEHKMRVYQERKIEAERAAKAAAE